MAFEIRRIVTGHDAHGSAIVHSDRQLRAQPVPNDTAWFNKIWSTEGWPADNSDRRDGAESDTGLASANGTVLRIVEMPPGHRSPMHRTQSLDYGIVLFGEVELVLDEGRTVQLKSGDVVIQRGTIHAWNNYGTTTARMVFVLLSAAAPERA
jgi:quercetin dioxygenase-like cupin family protein